MTSSRMHALGATLALIVATVAHADDADRRSAATDIAGQGSTSQIASDYFDANWALFTNDGARGPKEHADATPLAAGGSEAGGNGGRGGHQTPSRSVAERSTDYFDANWAVTGSP